MKTNFLKTSLSAFAFALAIVASFAFSPALSSTEDVDPVQGYIQTTDELTPCQESRDDCEPTGMTTCTVGVPSKTVYSLFHQPGLTSCQTQLFLPQ